MGRVPGMRMGIVGMWTVAVVLVRAVAVVRALGSPLSP